MTYPKTSRAAVLSAYGEPLQVEEMAVPALEPNALLAQVEVATMCGTDVHIQRGDFGSFSRLPLIMGHEIVGRVAALGSERTTDALGRPLAEGDRIVWSYAWCGHCYWCTVTRQPTLCSGSRMYGWGSASEPPHLTGGFAEYAYVMPRCEVVKVPEHIDPAVISSATCAFRTVIHGYERLGRLEPMETVVIQGSGPIGLYALAFAVQAGCRQVVCIGAPDARLDVAKRWGAIDVMNVERTQLEERRERVFDLTEGRGADVVVECSGAGAALTEGLKLVRRGGRYLVIGQADPTPVLVQGTDFNTRQLTVYGVLSGDMPHYYRAVQFLGDHAERFPFGDLLGERYPLDGVNDALAAMAAGRQIKPVIVPGLSANGDERTSHG